MKYKNQIFGLTVILLFSVFLISCGSKIEFSKEPVVIENPNNSTSLTCFVNFKTKTNFETVTFYVSDENRNLQLEYSPKEKTENGFLIYLMRPDQKNQIKIEITDSNGKKRKHKKTLVFSTPGLPESDMEFPKIEITERADKTDLEDLILFNPRRRVPMNLPNANKFNQSFGMLVVANKNGDVLWYYRTDSRISDFDLLPNGNLSYMTQDSRIEEIDFAGNLINRWYAVNRPEGKMEGAIPVDALTFHHDVSILPNGNRLVCSTEIKEIENYYTSERDKDAPRKTQKVMGDVILEFTPEGKIVHRWSSFDEMPVMRIGYETFSNYWIRRGFPGVIDWSHANAVVPHPTEDAYLVNFRYQSAMIKVNKTSGEIEWIFAEPTGWGEDLQDKLLQIPEEGWNWHQHSPRFTSDGNLLFFNNNNYKARPFDEPALMRKSPSYAVEYKIDEENLTVERIWDTMVEGENDIISIAMGRVGEIPGSGNILAAYGAIVSQDHIDEMTWWNRAQYPMWTMVREFTHTVPAEILWEMRLQPGNKESGVSWTLFGADRIEFR